MIGGRARILGPVRVGTTMRCNASSVESAGLAATSELASPPHQGRRHDGYKVSVVRSPRKATLRSQLGEL